MKITKNSKIEEVLNHPKGRDVMVKHEVPCLGCPMAAMEMKTLEIGKVAEIYQLDLDSILEDLNN